MRRKKVTLFKTSDFFRVYTDGACEPNPGIGGYCAVVFRGDDVSPRMVVRGGDKETTNNRMEIMGVLCIMRYFEAPSIINFYSDSQYVCNSINTWLNNWIRKGAEMKNMDLWREIYELKKKHTVKAIWIKGHSGNFYNEYADGISMESIIDATKNKKRTFEKVKLFAQQS